MDATQKKSVAIWVSQPYQRDELFNPQSRMNRDNCLAPYRSLKFALEAGSAHVHTQDYYIDQKLVPTDLILLDMPKQGLNSIPQTWAHARKHLLVQESEVVLPKNWDAQIHDLVDSVFTWHPDLLGQSSKYVRVHFSQDLPTERSLKRFPDRNFLTLIAGNKGSNHQLELYSKRVEAIRYFENAGVEFDLFGGGWDQVVHKGFVRKAINKIPRIAKVFGDRYSSYRGRVENKFDTLNNYKFAICFENAQLIPGYVTEKIFDCLLSGCVPVYWGAPDISRYVPETCFIDFRNFTGYPALLKHLQSFSEQDYDRFLSESRIFLSSALANPFKSETFGKTIANRILSE